LWERVDAQRVGAKRHQMGGWVRGSSRKPPHPPSLREGTFSREGRRKKAALLAFAATTTPLAADTLE
jgi:hypothetical protein